MSEEGPPSASPPSQGVRKGRFSVRDEPLAQAAPAVARNEGALAAALAPASPEVRAPSPVAVALSERAGKGKRVHFAEPEVVPPPVPVARAEPPMSALRPLAVAPSPPPPRVFVFERKGRFLLSHEKSPAEVAADLQAVPPRRTRPGELTATASRPRTLLELHYRRDRFDVRETIPLPDTSGRVRLDSARLIAQVKARLDALDRP